MKWFKRFRNETKTISTLSTAAEIADFFGKVSVDSEKLNSATYYACMKIRCDSVAKLPLKVMEQDGDSTRTATAHPLYKLLHDRPNPYMTSHDFLWLTEYYRLNYGNAFWYPRRNGAGDVEAIYVLPTPAVSILIDDAGISKQSDKVFYQYTDPKLGPMLLLNEDLLHFKNFAVDGIRGTGVAHYLMDIIQNEKYGARIQKNRSQNGLQDPIIVQYVGDLSEAIQGKIRKKFDGLGGAENAGRVIPIPPDFKVTQLETKLVNSQFFELQGLTAKHIANAFGVKAFQLNDLSNASYANIENQNRAYYSDTLINVLREYEQEMHYKLFSEKEQETYFCQFNADSFQRADPDTRYANYQRCITSGIMSPAEVRKLENLPHLEHTDDLLYGNGAVIKLSQIGSQYDAADAAKGGEETEQDV